jgi:hypothetical protein
MKSNFKEYLNKFKESGISILPFFIIIMVLYLLFLPFNIWSMLSIIIATIIMICGMALFNVGVDLSTLKMGEYVGANLSKSRRFSFMIILSFIMGFIVTIAEPDLMVLAEQVPGISSKWIVLITVSAGTGVFLVLSTIRTIFNFSIKTILMVSYLVALGLSFFSPNDFLPLAFDSIGVTTGAVSVPFIMSFGLGIAAIKSSKNNSDDGFGLIALASIGPVIAILIVSLFIKSDSSYLADVVNSVSTGSEMGGTFITNLLSYLKEVFIVIIPIFIFFLIYNFKYLKLAKRTLLRMFVGLIYTYLGLVLFLCGVSSGYLTTANILGSTIVTSGYKWLLIPIGLVIGFFLVFAEPAVHVLNAQIEEITGGIIRKKTMLLGISLGVSIAMLIIVFRCLFNINFIYFIVPLVIIMVVLCRFCSNMFVAIAFDSGGAAAGSLTASFVLPFIIGVCTSLNIEILQFAFGTVAIIAIMPTIIIQCMGVRYKYIMSKNLSKKKIDKSDIQIIDFN